MVIAQNIYDMPITVWLRKNDRHNTLIYLERGKRYEYF